MKTSRSTRGRTAKVLGVTIAASLLPGLFSSFAASAQPAQLAPGPRPPLPTPQPRPPSREDWRAAMSRRQLPKKGCFTASYPDTEWREVPCGLPSRFPNPPARGPRPDTVGGGNDVSAQVTGLISTAIGSFDTVSGVTSVSGDVGGNPPPKANVFMLQINTQFFPNPPACNKVAGCQGWQQFLFSQTQGPPPGPGQQSVVSGTTPAVFMEYWLLGFGPTCPAGQPWISDGANDCWFNGPTTYVPPQTVNDLKGLIMTATASTAAGGQDTVKLETTSGDLRAQGQDSVLNLGQFWNTAEFNVFGDCCSTQAVFNNGSTIVPRTRVIYGGTAPPNCLAQGFTAETNNLSFGPNAPAASQPGPAILFTESSAGGAPSACASAVSFGDTHLLTFDGVKYDFQAQGDFVLMQADPDFAVHTRQATAVTNPRWIKNATINKAVATQMGNTRVAICLNPVRLLINGKLNDLGDGKSLSLPGGVDVSRKGNVYQVIRQSGDSVSATLNDDGTNSWIDVSVGLGHAAPKVSGLLGTTNANVNAIATREGAVLKGPISITTRNGTVLKEPIAFEDLYHSYADSWRVAANESLLCDDTKIEPGIPEKLFYAKDLDPDVFKRAQAICTAAGVKEETALEDCTLDTAVLGGETAARVFVHAPVPGHVIKPVSHRVQ